MTGKSCSRGLNIMLLSQNLKACFICCSFQEQVKSNISRSNEGLLAIRERNPTPPLLSSHWHYFFVPLLQLGRCPRNTSLNTSWVSSAKAERFGNGCSCRKNERHSPPPSSLHKDGFSCVVSWQTDSGQTPQTSSTCSWRMSALVQKSDSLLTSLYIFLQYCVSSRSRMPAAAHYFASPLFFRRQPGTYSGGNAPANRAHPPASPCSQDSASDQGDEADIDKDFRKSSKT